MKVFDAIRIGYNGTELDKEHYNFVIAVSVLINTKLKLNTFTPSNFRNSIIICYKEDKETILKYLDEMGIKTDKYFNGAEENEVLILNDPDKDKVKYTVGHDDENGWYVEEQKTQKLIAKNLSGCGEADQIVRKLKEEV